MNKIIAIFFSVFLTVSLVYAGEVNRSRTALMNIGEEAEKELKIFKANYLEENNFPEKTPDFFEVTSKETKKFFPDFRFIAFRIPDNYEDNHKYRFYIFGLDREGKVFEMTENVGPWGKTSLTKFSGFIKENNIIKILNANAALNFVKCLEHIFKDAYSALAEDYGDDYLYRAYKILQEKEGYFLVQSVRGVKNESLGSGSCYDPTIIIRNWEIFLDKYKGIQKIRNIDIPSSAYEYRERGDAYLKEHEYLKAVSDYTMSIKIHPFFGVGYYHRGKAYHEQIRGGCSNCLALAIYDYGKAIEIEPNFIYYGGMSLASIFDKNVSMGEAIKDSTRVIKDNSNDAKAYYSRGVFYYEKADYDKAWADIHKAAELGYKATPEFLDKLKKASGRNK